ncbi:MAG: GMC family oxidoreductase [Deltaproteobacteria bacterium]|nr:GMC family oxidoreductase [Deltaproteobacteria bacterium]
MKTEQVKKQTEVVVVGSGPGGATAARQLARAGKKVILLERGQDYRRKAYYGTYVGALTYADRHTLLFTKEGLNVIRPLMLGGATSMYCGSAARPPAWVKERYGIDLDAYIDETIAEIGIAPLAPAERGKASTRIAEAALALGYQWEPLMKFIRPARSSHFSCGAKCMLGCRCGAKWNAAEWVDQAVAAGCELMTEARVDDLIIEGGQVGGVRGKLAGQPFEVAAEVVVLAAGGIGTPLILQRAGFFEAGRGLAMDTTVMVCGLSQDQGIGEEPPMTWGYTNDEVGYMLSTLIDPWLLFPMMAVLKSPRHLFKWPAWSRALGVMIKIKDEVSGGVTLDGDISKPMTERDQFRLNHGAIVAHRILARAGADPDSIFITPLRGTHPSATVRIGELLDEHLQTKVENLYVCDASTFPEALDRPTVLTIIGLAKRLAAHLLARGNTLRNSGTAAAPT